MVAATDRPRDIGHTLCVPPFVIDRMRLPWTQTQELYCPGTQNLTPLRHLKAHRVYADWRCTSQEWCWREHAGALTAPMRFRSLPALSSPLFSLPVHSSCIPLHLTSYCHRPKVQSNAHVPRLHLTFPCSGTCSHPDTNQI